MQSPREYPFPGAVELISDSRYRACRRLVPKADGWAVDPAGVFTRRLGMIEGPQEMPEGRSLLQANAAGKAGSAPPVEVSFKGVASGPCNGSPVGGGYLSLRKIL